MNFILILNLSIPILIYTDGASSGNPGPGGLGVVLIYKGLRKEISEGYSLTTNNRMELLAVIRGLEAVKWKNAEVIIYSDSKYVSDAVNNKWLFTWEKNQFKKKKNVDLWKRFLELYRKHNIKIEWIKGHAKITENERCDKLAVEASRSSMMKEDIGYISEKESDVY